MRAVDEEAFLDAKKLFITTKLDDMMRETVDMGLPQFQKYFAGSRVKNLMQEMLEPEEYQNFSRMIEMIGKAMSVPKGGSGTQPLQAIERALRADATGLGSKAVPIVLASIRAPGRLLAGTIGDDLTQRIATRQLDSYYNALADALFDQMQPLTLKKLINTLIRGNIVQNKTCSSEGQPHFLVLLFLRTMKLNITLQMNRENRFNNN